jgi:hypothetical protein
VSFELSPASATVLLGTRFDITGLARIPKGSSLKLDLAARSPFASGEGPRSGDGGLMAAATGPFEILGVSVGEARGEGDSSVVPLRVEAAAFELGPLVFPALRWALVSPGGAQDTVQSPPVRVGVEPPESARQEGAELRDIKEPLSPALGPWVLAGLLLLAAAIALFLRLRRRKPEGAAGALAEPADARPPHQIALDELDALPGLGLSVKDFYDRLSDILRVYLERSLRVPALQMTTHDLQRSLSRTALDPALRGRLKSLLDRCDLAKFARFLPAQEEYSRDIAEAKGIVLAATPPAQRFAADGVQETAL